MNRIYRHSMVTHYEGPRRFLQDTAARYFHVSNALTYVAVCAGLAAIGAATALESWSLAGALIALSALADTYDGSFAYLFRRTDSQKAIGVQLDSLADALTFGLVPIVCLSVLISFDAPTVAVVTWFVVALAYVLCAITRLAAYNLRQGGDSNFIGIPTTVAGLLLSTVFLLQPSLSLSLIVVAGCSIAMVAYIPLPRPKGFGLAMFTLWPVGLIALHAAAFSRSVG